MFSKSGFKVLDVSKRIKELKFKVQHTKGLPLKLSPLANPSDSSNDTTASSLAAAGCFFESVIKAAHTRIANKKNAVVFATSDCLPLSLIQAAILNAYNIVRQLFSGRNTSETIVQFYSIFVMEYLPWNLQQKGNRCQLRAL